MDLSQLKAYKFDFKSGQILFKVFHKDFLLDEFNPNDANSLNERFYKELLYILGLQETKQGSKVLIVPSSEPQNAQNTLYNAITAKLSKDKQNFENIMNFIVLWLNRILFLKLIEANLVRFNDDKNLKFLNLNKVPNFKALSQLFFEILAKKPQNRTQVNSTLAYLPYLNSSLFARQKCENSLDISALDDGATLSYYAHTQIKDKNAKAKVGKVGLLAYLFEFLDSFDFGSDEDSTELALQKELISSSVLGLVFEKLNGYKEGSFYTPSFITSYMCEKSLQKVVCAKFNEANPQWNAQNLSDIKQEIWREIRQNRNSPNSAHATNDIIAKHTKTLQSIRICDPAVGSGHFLVSALNEMIKIYHTLGLSGLGACHLRLNNDEIIITKPNGKIYEYKKPATPNDENHAIQKALFALKKQIIENNLFGVDINPNSCEITKLRLWIELLKNSYYLQKGDEGFDANLDTIGVHQMQTLPNIDINIKCGNSLISLFELNENDDKGKPKKYTFKWLQAQNREFYQNFRYQLSQYHTLVQQYKDNLGVKDDIIKQIGLIKKYFRNTLLSNGFVMENLVNMLKKFIEFYGDDEFKNRNAFEMEMIKIARNEKRNFKFQPNLLQDKPKELDKNGEKLLKTLKIEFDKLESLKKQETFEWRFEFPEVLNEQGEFMGFDLIIGNPPYIDYRKIDEQTKEFLARNSAIYECNKEGSIYVYFIEKGKEILAQNGNMIFINPIAYICQEAGFGLRKFIDKNLSLNLMLNVSNLKVFDRASTYTCINHFTHKNSKCQTFNFGIATEKNDLSTIKLQEIEQCEIENLSLLLNPITTKIFKANHPQLNTFCEIFCGLSKTGFRANVEFDKKETNNPFLEASDIFRYEFKQDKFLSQISYYYSQDKINIFENSEIIFMARMTNFIRCCVAPKGYFGGKVNVLYNFKVDKRYILGILNSKFMSYFYAEKYFASHMQGGAFGFDTLSVGSLPIAEPNLLNQSLIDEIINLVDKILEFKKQGKDTSEFEKDIDNLIYKLYNLNSNEIQIIQGT